MVTFFLSVQFLTACHYSNSQNLVISFEYSWFLAKNLSNFVSLPWKLHNRKCHNGHGLRMPNEAFFHRNPKLFGLSRQFGQINFGSFGASSSDLSAPILVLWVPCPYFPLINHYFYKKLSHYIQIPNIHLGLGFEFGSQIISHRESVVRDNGCL